MTRDREVAEALSGGLNCLAAIRAALQAETLPAELPRPEWVATLHAMEQALEAIAAEEVRTALAVGEQDRERVRRVSVLLSEWITHQRSPQELPALVESTLALFGVLARDSAAD